MRRSCASLFNCAGALVALLGCDSTSRIDVSPASTTAALESVVGELGASGHGAMPTVAHVVPSENISEMPSTVELAGDSQGAPGTGEPVAVESESESPESEPVAPDCDAILVRAWTSIQPAFRLLGRTDASAYQEAYMASGDTFRERCVALTSEQRACLAAAEPVVSGIDTCRIDSALGPNHRLRFPELHDFVGPLPVLRTLSTDEAEAVLASVVGVWRNDFVGPQSWYIWTIGADGTTVRDLTTRGNTRAPTTVVLSFESADRMNMLSGSTVHSYPFARDGDDAFYASTSSTLVNGVFLAPDHTSFAIRSDEDYVVYEGGTCNAVSGQGWVIEATCGFGLQDGSEVFNAAYAFPGQVTGRGIARETSLMMWVVGDRLVDARMGRYERQ